MAASSTYQEWQHPRERSGKWTTKQAEEAPGGLAAFVLDSPAPPAPEGPELTLAGTSRVYDMQRDYRLREQTTRPPVIDVNDTVATAVKKWAKYVGANSDLDPQGYAAARGWLPLDPEQEAQLRSKIGSTAGPHATVWDSSADPDAQRYTFLETRPSAKEGAWRNVYSRLSWKVVNLANRRVSEAITNDLRDFVEAQGGDPDDIDASLVTRWLKMTGPDAAKDGMRNRLTARHALGDTPIYGVRPPKPMSEYGTDVEAFRADQRRYTAALVALCGDEAELRRLLGATDPSKDDEKTITIPNVYPPEHSFNDVLANARAVRRESNTRLAATQMVTERFGMADDLYLTRQGRDRATKHSATVWEDKKHIPTTHVEAAQRSTFHRHGMGHVEIDQSVDLDDFHKVETEWAALSRRVPHTTAPSRMAFRLTGRHKAQGVYSPGQDAIAVDPRHPSSMWHEYVHHLDHTNPSGQVSLSDEFRPILRKAQQAIATDTRFATLGKTFDYWRTPTEVFSRSAELWLHWRGVNTSLNGDDTTFDGNPAYESLYPMREQITAFFDTTFGDPTVAR